MQQPSRLRRSPSSSDPPSGPAASGGTTVLEQPSPPAAAGERPGRRESPPAGRPAPPPPPGGAFLLTPVVQPVFTRERFSDEQREIDRAVREFAREELHPRRSELAVLDEALSLGLLRQAGELGLTGVDVPGEYGGMELDKTTSALVVEALTTGGAASWIVTFSAHTGIGTLPIVFFGTEDQKRRYLPKLATAEYLGAYALTEPEAGSDAMSLKTRARLADDGQSYLLSGSKQFVSNGGWADLFVVFATVDGRGPTAFLVERGSQGLTVGPEEHKLGIKGSSTVPLTLEEVRVPAANVLGQPGDGMRIALNVLNVGRFKLAAAELGGCKTLIGEAAAYALERRQFGQPIAYFDAVRSKLADMVTRTYMLDGVVYRTVGMMDEGIRRLDPTSPAYPAGAMQALEEYAIEASIAKVLGSETIFRVTDHGVQIYGGYGFSEEYPMAAAFRDCRIDRIFEGTNEINRMVIYGYYLKKALTEELPLRQAERQGLEPEPASGPFAWEADTLERCRRLTVKCLFEAISLYGQDLRNEQVVGEDLADLVIACYAASSALNRTLQLDAGRRRERAYRALARLAVATCVGEVWRLYPRLRATLFCGPRGRRVREPLDALLARLHLPFDPVVEIRALTDDLFHHGRYRYE
jgi:alkylation response protein AidB-like acyl-CoA dehydrogenase